MGVVVPAPERPCSGQWRLGSTSKPGTFVGCYRPEDVLGKGFSVIFPEEQRPSVEAQYPHVSGARCRPSARPTAPSLPAHELLT
jgi:hypothetical protein